MDRGGLSKAAWAVALASFVLLAPLLEGCKSCGKEGDADAPPPPGAFLRRTELPPDAGPAAERDLAMWERARAADPNDGVEELAVLAVHEGAVGLVEASSIPELRLTALRAMGYADGYAQLPTLAKVSTDGDDEQARAALDAAVTLGTRVDRNVDLEDAEELAAGCEGLVGLAKNTKKAKERRVLAIRALRMLPCNAGDLPSDLDAR